LVFDHVALVGGIYNSDMSNKQVLLVCVSARQKYDVYLDKQKLLKTQAITAQKKKFFCEVEKLKKKLEADQESLLSSADNDAEKAEHGHKLTLIAQ